MTTFGPCFICGKYGCEHDEPAVIAAWLEVLARLQPERATVPPQAAAPPADKPVPRTPPDIAADIEAMRAYRKAEPLNGDTMQSSLGPGR